MAQVATTTLVFVVLHDDVRVAASRLLTRNLTDDLPRAREAHCRNKCVQSNNIQSGSTLSKTQLMSHPKHVTSLSSGLLVTLRPLPLLPTYIQAAVCVACLQYPTNTTFWSLS